MSWRSQPSRSLPVRGPATIPSQAVVHGRRPWQLAGAGFCAHNTNIHKHLAEVLPVALEEAQIAKPSEERVIQVLRSIMSKADLDNLTCGDVCAVARDGNDVDALCLCVAFAPQVRKELELYFKQDLSDMKRLIDEKMMMILGQMEFSR